MIIGQGMHEIRCSSGRYVIAPQTILHYMRLRSLLFIRIRISIASRMRFNHGVLIVGVDDQGLAQLTGCAGHLAEDQHAPAVRLRGNELFGDQIHAVTQRRDQGDAARIVQRRQFLEREETIEVPYRHIADRAVLAVDASDELLQLIAQLFVVLDARP